MPTLHAPRHTAAMRGLLLLLLVAGGLNLGVDCGGGPVPLPGSGAQLFTSPQEKPLALSADGTRLYVANTTSGTLSIVDVTTPSAPVELAQVKVGLDPVGVAVRPKVNPGDANEDELVFVTNHISDTVSVVSRAKSGVVQTIQALDANGVTTTDEPVGIAFASPTRAFVALDNPNQILVLDLDAAGNATIDATRIQLSAQAPRALTVANGRLYVAAFESNNATEFPTCAPNDNRTLNTNPAVFDQGCSFKLRLADAFNLSTGSFNPGTLFDFAVSPNIGGRVIHDGDNPDRDLFVYDATTLAPIATVNAIGTLLYGVAVGNGGNRVYVTNTDARNVNNGLTALGNQMFLNRLSYVDCTSGCTAFGTPTHVDLDVAAPGSATVPTPYGIAVSGNGATLVVTAAGSDGTAGWNGASGLYTLSSTGVVQGSVRVGAIPQGVALKSAPNGAPETAFVLNTVDSTVSVVNVSTPSAPAVVTTIAVGSDPTPTAVKNGRIAFSSARGSTSGTFSCESCHPNANTDQLLWTINTAAGPGGTDPNGAKPEPRTTMPIRGLRDTIPLHWDGTLADPLPNTGFTSLPGDTAPDCNPASVGEVGCVRHLVNASLSGVMCTPSSCPNGPSGLPGAFTGQERDDMALFLTAVSFPPSPKRLPTDALSSDAKTGLGRFFTDDDGFGLNHNIGPLLGFAPATCADNTAGCHALPLTVSTNSPTVGRFDAPSIRGLWDRYVIFSNGLMSSQEAMVLAQNCANGILPPSGTPLPGDPCDPAPAGNGLNPVYPSGELVWDPVNVGASERGSFMASFALAFELVYGFRGDRVWDFINEMSVGLPGLTGRQVSLDAATATLPATVGAMTQIEGAAAEGRITAVARGTTIGELRYRPATGLWTNASGGTALTGAQLRTFPGAIPGEVITLTADLPETVAIGGPRQPLLSPDGPAEAVGDPPPIPRPSAGVNGTFTLTQSYVDPAAKVLVDGAVCATCTVSLTTGSGGAPAVDITLVPAPPAGVHAVQVLNPNGLASNEMPIVTQ